MRMLNAEGKGGRGGEGELHYDCSLANDINEVSWSEGEAVWLILDCMRLYSPHLLRR